MFDFNFFNFDWSQIATPERVAALVKVGVILLIGLPLLFLLRKWARTFFTKKYAPHYGMLSGKIVFYLGFTMIVVMVMQQLGFSLAPLLGAAGIVGVALGFASQTSVSNVISGLFLIFERPFQVSDVIRVDGQFVVGTSSGAALQVVHDLAEEGVLEADDTVVVMLCDRGDKYADIPLWEEYLDVDW